MKEECISCSSVEELVESGGQFCGGIWFLCKKCDDQGKALTEFMKSDAYLEHLNKTLKEKK